MHRNSYYYKYIHVSCVFLPPDPPLNTATTAAPTTIPEGEIVIHNMSIIFTIICLDKITILHHGMQSFHIIVYCTPVYCTLVYCTTADRSDRFATSISIREMFRN